VDTERNPWRLRFRVPLTLIPPVVGIAVAASLWGSTAQLGFFTAAAQVLALGAVGMALTGRFFRLSIHTELGTGGVLPILNVVFVLVAVGLGLGFSLSALAKGAADGQELAITAGALSAGISAFAVQALFGTPGLRDETPPAESA
jgi:hypothetical protein